MKMNIHVAPYGGQSAAKQEGLENPLSVHQTQKSATDSATPLARLFYSELVIHRPDGTICDKDSYGEDPFPLEDRKH
ncbi:MAG: DUF2188 domain-containing protein [Bacteroidota bacterium]